MDCCRFRFLLRLLTGGLCVALSVAVLPAWGQPPAMMPPTDETLPNMPQPVESVSRPVPISLDTVFRMADEQNAAIARARAKVDEACAAVALAKNRWMPDIYVGTNYYRHEGGIQDEDGTFIDSSTGAILGGMEIRGRFDIREITYRRVMAERKAWQHQGELSRINSETLLEAASTYIDLLAARHGEAVAKDLHKRLQPLLKRAEKLAKTEPAIAVEVARLRAESFGRSQVISKLQAQAQAASAKLTYLLGLDPCVQLIPIDTQLMALDLVHADAPACELVAQAMAQGPGIREMEGLLALIDRAAYQAKGPAALMPSVELGVIEGGFGAGPGSSLTWDNRFDVILQVRWNLTELSLSRYKKRIMNAQRAQAHLAYEDLRGKLAAGVQASQVEIQEGRKQISFGEQQVKHATEARDKSRERLYANIKGSSYSEVLLSMRVLALAQINYISALRDYDKAQVRLLLLLGGCGGEEAIPVEGPAVEWPAPKE